VIQVTNDESIALARRLPLEEGIFVASRLERRWRGALKVLRGRRTPGS